MCLAITRLMTNSVNRRRVRTLVLVSTIFACLSVRMLGVSTADQTNLLFRLTYQILVSHLLLAYVSDECWTCRVGLLQTSRAIFDRGLDCLHRSVRPKT